MSTKVLVGLLVAMNLSLSEAFSLPILGIMGTRNIQGFSVAWLSSSSLGGVEQSTLRKATRRYLFHRPSSLFGVASGGDSVDVESTAESSAGDTAVMMTESNTAAKSLTDSSGFIIDIGDSDDAIELETTRGSRQPSGAEIEDQISVGTPLSNMSSTLVDHDHLHHDPYFAAPDQETTMVNQTTLHSRNLISRRKAFEYGGMLLTGSVFTALLLGKAPQSSRLEVTPATPTRPSLLPQPVLKKTGDKNKSASTTAQRPGKSQTQTPPKQSTIKTKASTSAASKPSTATTKTSRSNTMVSPETGRLEPVNLTKVASETNINVTLTCDQGCISVDAKNFTKVQRAKIPPKWVPSWSASSNGGPVKALKTFSNSELLVAATVAGASTEMLRTGLLYPLSTIKVRVQQQQHNFTRRPPPLQQKIVTLGMNVKEKVQEGNLYAGITPTLLVSVPATGVYYGFRDVTKRMLSMTPMGDTWIALSGAFVGDVVSLCFRTPADALAVRLQAQNATVGDWLGDSLARLPMVIATDLPYLLSKVCLNRLFIHGSLSVDRYAELAVFTAIVAAFLSTPFDVVRTRILLNKELVVEDDQETEEEKLEKSSIPLGKEEPNTPAVVTQRPAYSVVQTMIQITKEGEGGYANLFAGWLERVIYLGIGRAWLEPIQLIGYVGIRDAVLLEWF